MCRHRAGDPAGRDAQPPFFGRNFVTGRLLLPRHPQHRHPRASCGLHPDPAGVRRHQLAARMRSAGSAPSVAAGRPCSPSCRSSGQRWALTGWHAILYLAYLQSIPQRLLRGGADRRRLAAADVLPAITLPLLAPGDHGELAAPDDRRAEGLRPALHPHQGRPGLRDPPSPSPSSRAASPRRKFGQASALAVVFLLVVVRSWRSSWPVRAVWRTRVS